MDVLIITPTKEEFESTVATYNGHWTKDNKYHHIRTKEEMAGYQMPVQIRFVGRWWELPDAPTLEFYSQHIVGAPATA
jgi:hypothetical protein